MSGIVNSRALSRIRTPRFLKSPQQADGVFPARFFTSWPAISNVKNWLVLEHTRESKIGFSMFQTGAALRKPSVVKNFQSSKTLSFWVHSRMQTPAFLMFWTPRKPKVFSVSRRSETGGFWRAAGYYTQFEINDSTLRARTEVPSARIIWCTRGALNIWKDVQEHELYWHGYPQAGYSCLNRATSTSKS